MNLGREHHLEKVREIEAEVASLYGKIQLIEMEIEECKEARQWFLDRAFLDPWYDTLKGFESMRKPEPKFGKVLGLFPDPHG